MTNQISAPTPCWGNPSSTVTTLLVLLTESLIVALSSGLIDRRFMTYPTEEARNWLHITFEPINLNWHAYLCIYPVLCKNISSLDVEQSSKTRELYEQMEIQLMPNKFTKVAILINDNDSTYSLHSLDTSSASLEGHHWYNE